MAFIGKDEYFPLWLPEALSEDLINWSSVTLWGTPEEPETAAADPEPSCGFIVHDWFGPFLLSPSSRSLRGQC
jgi:hypothetical protein